MSLGLQHFIYLFLLLAGCGYGAIRGGAPERWGAGLLFGGVIATNVVSAMARSGFQLTRIPEMEVDILLAVAFLILAVRANRYWPIWAAAVQLDAILTHIVMFRAETGSLSYAFTLWLFSIPLPVLIGVGAWRHRQRLRSYGEDFAWRS